MAKKSMGDKLSDWLSGYRNRPDDEYYGEEYYDEEEALFEDYDQPKRTSSVEDETEDGYVDIYDTFGDEEEEREESQAASSSRWKGFGSRRERSTNTRTRRGEQDREAEDMNQDHSGPKLYPMGRGNGATVRIVEPARFDGTTKTIIDEIRSGTVLLINLEQVSRQDYIRFVDFLAGAVYIMGSTMQYANDRFLVIAPKNVKLSGGKSREIYEVEPVASVY